MITRTARIIGIEQNTPSTKVVTLDVEPPFTFEAGQFMTLLVDKEGQTFRRPYSIASAPKDARIELAIKLYAEGAITPLLFDVAEGWATPCIGPFGRFTLNESRLPVFIAAGSGIAPIMSMLRHIEDRYPATLFYSNKSFEDVIYAKEIQTLVDVCGTITYVQTFTQTPPPSWNGHTGRISADMIARVVNDVHRHTYYVCGSPAFVTDIIAQLHSLGVKAEHIKKEVYD